VTPALATALDVALDRTIVGGYSRIGYEVRRRAWDALPRLDGRTVAISGATAGLGRAAATELAGLGARVLLLARSVERGEAARAGIEAETGSVDVIVIACDLASLASVRAAADQLTRSEARLDVLINNAGVLAAGRERTADGIELTLATNVVGPFLLTNLLVPALADSPPGRIVNVSSGGMYGQRIRVADLEMDREAFDGVSAYARTKRAEVILTELWARRLAAQDIHVHAMHPGWADTPGVQSSLPRFHRLTRPLLRSPEAGADTIVWLAAAPEAVASSGGFWHDRRRRPTHRLPRTRESEAERELLWRRCSELAGWEDS
jgi:dehydrogenase/reductase SDR family protein 12